MTNAYFGAAYSTRADQLRSREAKVEVTGKADVETKLRDLVQSILPTGQVLPAFKSLSLHLIRGLNTISINGVDTVVVAFPPEFLYVADVGYPALIGVILHWTPTRVGFGDPTFPDFAGATIRSVPNANESALIFPDVIGQLIIGIDPSADPAAVKQGLQNEGLWDVDLFGTFATARCTPFQERPICKALLGKLSFVRNAEPNHVVRLIDISPGWRVERLA